MKRFLISVAITALALLISADAGALSIGKTKYIFKKGQGNWVKVCPGNKKQGPFDHPKEVSREDVTKALSSLMYFRPGFLSLTGKKGTEYQLFTDEEIGMLADNLVQALAEADAESWVDFSVNSFRGQAFIGSFRQSDGVLFIKDGKINLAMRNIAVKTGGDDSLNTFDPTKGYRSLTRLTAIEGQDQVADNWIAMDLSNIPNRKSDAVSESPTLTITTPGDKPAETPAKTPEERLLDLQKLYDQGLISEDEYNKKRQEILDEL